MSVRHIERRIEAGWLNLSLTQDGHRLDELLAFGSRLNPRRGYLFVSRVLGKHIPVRPSTMDRVHAELAERIDLLGDSAYVVGMAETAVGLGAGLARHLAERCDHAVFHHTTRFLVPEPWIRVREAHSHADTMHLAKLDNESRRAVYRTQDMVLVDDEISTGRTLAQLAGALAHEPELAQVKRLHIVSLASWLSEVDRSAFLAQLPEGLEVRFVQLMAGSFSFVPDPTYQCALPRDAHTDFSDSLMVRPLDPVRSALEQDGLFGKLLDGQADATTPQLRETGRPMVVFGMGEFLDRPFRAALVLEQRGCDVLFQSSTRSPIKLGDCITSCIDHPAPGDSDKRHYLYNSPAGYLPVAMDGIGRADLARDLEESFETLHYPSTAEEIA